MLKENKEGQLFGAFAPLFIKSMLWGMGWHFAAYPIEALISKPQWVYITKLTLGVIITYPFVESFVVMMARLCGATEETVEKLRAWLFAGYFGAFLSGGTGKALAMAADPKEH